MSDRVYFHWQNLNDKPAGRQGSGLRCGRAWFRFFGYQVHWEWSLFTARCGASFTVTQAEESGFQFHLALPLLASFYITIAGGVFARLSRWVLKQTRADHEDRELALNFFGWAIWWSIWRDAMGGWSSTDPKWRNGCFHFDDFFLGRVAYSTRDLSTEETRIAFPEATYAATVKIYESTWKRPRWFARRCIRSEVKVPEGVPFPGKGENSWDCGEDAAFGITCGATTVEGAIAWVVESVLKSRRRHGGSVNWVPSRKGAA